MKYTDDKNMMRMVATCPTCDRDYYRWTWTGGELGGAELLDRIIAAADMEDEPCMNCRD